MIVRRRTLLGRAAAPLAAGALVLASAFAAPQGKPPANPPEAPVPAVPLYNRDVRPILAENCFACHGPDSAARKAGLRLDRFADATARASSGAAAIVPGDIVASELAHRIGSNLDDPLHMPPASTHKSLTERDRIVLLRWIDQGAKYEAHWSYIAPTRPALPAVKNTSWVKNPIDRFVLARLEKEGLSPAPEADKRTLIRRVTLDLTGLPPTPAEVDVFVNDTRPDAYERLVDRLLQSPRWGEHRARYWLDYARYADSNGIHFDNYREMFAYRDWVIGAFNRNLSFDQFTLEQLAGDLLPNPTLEQRVATGFVRCNITTNEGGAINEEYLVLYTRDRTETAAQVWLGATAGCAVCHDHKFDPISQREFYSLSAFFNNTTQNAMDGNIQNTPPTIFVPQPAERARFNALAPQIIAARKVADDRKAAAKPDFEKWLSSASASALASAIPTDGLRFAAPLSEGSGTKVAATFDGAAITAETTAAPGWESGQTAAKAFVRKNGATAAFPQAGDFENDQPFTAAAWVKLAPNSGGSIMSRMDEASDYRGWDIWVEGGRVGSHLINKWPDDAVKVVSRNPLKTNVWSHVCIVYGGGKSKDSLKVYIDGAEQATDVQADALKSTIRTKVPFKIGQRSGAAGLDNSAIQDVRLYSRALAAGEVARLAQGTRSAYLLAKPNAALSAAERDELFAGWINSVDAPYRDLRAKVTALESEESAIRMRGTAAHVAQEKPSEPIAFILNRGEYDQRRDQVKPATPSSLPPMPKSFPRNRLGLARWLLLPENPLTTRVSVNRMWQEVFGQGLVRTAGDFGVMGELPSHPELLDWLAVEFRSPSDGVRAWDIKRMYRMIVTSATYRQAAVMTPGKRLKDPANRLLSRGPRFRMDAEMIRDYALSASGLMTPKIGGPSVRPYQPDGVWEAVAMIGSNTRDYKRDSGENLYRRSLYTFWKRAAPPASMDIFNAPSREVCTVRRERTNTPLQALVTLNDIQFVEAARALAEKAIQSSPDPRARMDFIAKRLLARSLTPTEERIVEMSLGELEAHYQGHPADARALVTTGESMPDAKLAPQTTAAYTMLVNQMMNLDEVLNK